MRMIYRKNLVNQVNLRSHLKDHIRHAGGDLQTGCRRSNIKTKDFLRIDSVVIEETKRLLGKNSYKTIGNYSESTR